MATKLRYPYLKGGARGETVLSGTITIGAAGAISAAVGFIPSKAAGIAPGVVKAATKTARYTFLYDRKYASVGRPHVTLEGPADAAFGNADGNVVQVRNVTANGFDVQVFLASSGADTETTSGNKIHWSAVVREI
jgi:hypothetical protein